MKTKKFPFKLALNKKTIANLNPGEMNGVLGGWRTEECPGISTYDAVYCICATNEATICQLTCLLTCDCH
jgi:hypothetical protein